MPPMPTMSLRAAPEHHALIRDLARALKDHSDFADVLRRVLQGNAQHDVTQRNADDGVLQDVLRRIAEHDGVLRDVSQRIAALDNALQEATRRNTKSGATPIKRKATPTADVSDDRTEGGTPLWTDGKAGARRLTETGLAILRETVAAGATPRAIAERLGVKPQNVARLIRNNLGDSTHDA
ncbi:MAG: hypothetical protein ABT940_05715 [Alphaproteobacteria bacterium]